MAWRYLTTSKVVATNVGIVALCPKSAVKEAASEESDDRFLIDHCHTEFDFPMEGVIVRQEHKAIWLADKIRAADYDEACLVVDHIVSLIRSLGTEKIEKTTHSLLRTPTIEAGELYSANKGAVSELYKLTMSPSTKIVVDQSVVEIRRKNGRVTLSSWPLFSPHAKSSPGLLYASPGVEYPNSLVYFHLSEEKRTAFQKRLSLSALHSNRMKFSNLFALLEIPWPEWVTKPSKTTA